MDRTMLIKKRAQKLTEELFASDFNETEVLCVLRLATAVGERANPKASKMANAVVDLLMADAGMP
jgi:hypothetical protein